MLKKKIQELGLKKLVRLSLFKLKKLLLMTLLLPKWYLFKIKNIGYLKLASQNTKKNAEVKKSGFIKEEQIEKFLKENPKKSFLEIGIGDVVHHNRIKVMIENQIEYTACDFEHVCNLHKKELSIYGIHSKFINYIGNTVGTYSWTMFELLKEGRKFDIIYIDGHHTFYVDLPAIMLAHMLLKEGGYLILDDISWNLNRVKTNMMNSISQWFFYNKIYNFNEYTKEQMDLCHMQEIGKEILLKKLQYTLSEKWSADDWWMMIKSEKR